MRAQAPKLRHFNLPVASRARKEMLIDLSFPGGYPMKHDGRRGTEEEGRERERTDFVYNRLV